MKNLKIIYKGYFNKSWTFVQQRCYIRYNHVTGGNPQLPQMCFYNLVEDLSNFGYVFTPLSTIVYIVYRFLHRLDTLTRTGLSPFPCLKKFLEVVLAFLLQKVHPLR